MRGETAAANLTLAGLAGGDDAAAIVGHANVEGRNGEAQVAAAGQERKFDAHHGQSAELDHALAVDEFGRDAAAEILTPPGLTIYGVESKQKDV
jgi:hypothetical protein